MSVDIGSLDHFPCERLRIVNIGGRQIGIVRWRDRIHAVNNLCPHQGGPLCRGVLSPRLTAAEPGEMTLDEFAPVLACPWHGWEFDLRTGRAILDPKVRVRIFPARVAVGRVLVDVNDASPLSGTRQSRRESIPSQGGGAK